MPGGPEQGERGEDVGHGLARRGPRVIGVCAMLAVLGAMATLGYDHRQTDMSMGWTALSDGRVASVEASGATGPSSLMSVGHSGMTTRPLPPVLRLSTSVGPARGPDGFAVSSSGWIMLRLGELGLDTEGGQIIEISPTGDTFVGLPLLRWRTAAIVGVTDQGFGVFREGTSLNFLGPDGADVPLLDLRRLGVRNDLSNLADVALAPDGRIAVLVGDGTGPVGYRLLQRAPGGAPDRTTDIPRAVVARLAARSGGPVTHPAVAFAGRDVVVAGETGLVSVREGQVQGRVRLAPTGGGRLPHAPSTVVGIPGGRWMLKFDHLVVLDRSGSVRHPGFGPCPSDPAVRSQCPAVISGHRLPHPSEVLPGVGAAAIGAVLLVFAWIGRRGRRECVRLRLALTIVLATWVTAWFLVSLAWGELHGSAPLLLLGVAALAILTPAYQALPHELGNAPGQPNQPNRPHQPWVPDVARSQAGAGRRRLEVIPLPSGS